MTRDMDYIIPPRREKIGNSEVKLTPKILEDVRFRVKEMGDLPTMKKVEEVAKVYTSISPRTIEGYVRATRVHDEVFKLYMEGKVSYVVLSEISNLDPETGLFLVNEMLEKKFLPMNLGEIKEMVRLGHAKSWFEAVQKVVSKSEDPPITPDERRLKSQHKPPRGEYRNFDDLMKDILLSGTEWRLKVKAAIDFLPMVKDQAVHSFQAFTKLYMLRNTLKEQFEFVDQTVKAVLDRKVNEASSEAEKEASDVDESGGDRSEAPGRGESERTAGQAAIHGDGQDFPHSLPGEEEDGGRP